GEEQRAGVLGLARLLEHRLERGRREHVLHHHPGHQRDRLTLGETRVHRLKQHGARPPAVDGTSCRRSAASPPRTTSPPWPRRRGLVAPHGPARVPHNLSYPPKHLQRHGRITSPSRVTVPLAYSYRAGGVAEVPWRT